MGLLSAAEIEAMRDTTEEALPSTATIKRRKQVSDGQGGKTESLVTRASNVPCRLDPLRTNSDTAPDRGGRPTSLSGWLITFAAETTVAAHDQVTIAGRTFEVDLVREREDWELTLRVEASELGRDGPAPTS